MRLFQTKNIVEERTIKSLNPTALSVLLEAPFYCFIKEDVTDVSYNGKDLFLQSNLLGRQQIDLKFSKEEAFEFIKKIANVSNKNFSFKEPILDVSFNRYRLNAVHPLLAKDNTDGTVNFSIRILSPTILINPKNKSFAPKSVHRLLKKIIEKEKSIIISGSTGAGKTEFQKYLTSFIRPSSKVILIEDTYETFIKELFPALDVNVWLYEENGEEVMGINKLIKVALRNNPDWIIVAEIRGKEGLDLIKASSSGHPFLSTIHSESAKENLQRLLLISVEASELSNEILIKKIINSIKIGIHLEKIYNKRKKINERYIKEIVEYKYDNGIKSEIIYQSTYNEKRGSFKQVFGLISQDLAKQFRMPENWSGRKYGKEK